MRKLPSSPERRRLRAITLPNILATIAVLVSLTGTAVAATLYTGANVRDNTLTGKDLKDYTLSSTDFSTTAKTALKAKTGPTGDTGPAGPTGRQGSTGRKGVKGPDAGRAYGYISAADTATLLNPSSGGWSNPKSVDKQCGSSAYVVPTFLGIAAGCSPFAPTFPHYAYDCELITPDYCGYDRTGYGGAGRGATLMRATTNDVVSFIGDDNGSFVTLMDPGNILVTASLTFVRPKVDPYHSRVTCQPEVRQSNSSNAFTKLGVPQMVSGSDVHEIVHLTVTGAARFEVPGDYDFRVTCNLMDEYDAGDDIDNWTFVSGNATATTTEM